MICSTVLALSVLCLTQTRWGAGMHLDTQNIPPGILSSPLHLTTINVTHQSNFHCHILPLGKDPRLNGAVEAGRADTATTVRGGDATKSYIQMRRKISPKTRLSSEPFIAAELTGSYVQIGEVELGTISSTKLFLSTTLQALMVVHTATSSGATTWSLFNNVEDYIADNYHGDRLPWFEYSPQVANKSDTVSIADAMSSTAMVFGSGSWIGVATSALPALQPCQCSAVQQSSEDTANNPYPHLHLTEQQVARFVRRQCDAGAKYVAQRHKMQKFRAVSSFDHLVEAVCLLALEIKAPELNMHQARNENDYSVATNRMLGQLRGLNYDHQLASVFYYRAILDSLDAADLGSHDGAIWMVLARDDIQSTSEGKRYGTSPTLLLGLVEEALDEMYMAGLFSELRLATVWLINIQTCMLAVGVGGDKPHGCSLVDADWVDRILLLEALAAFHTNDFESAVSRLVDLTKRLPDDFMVTFVLEGIAGVMRSGQGDKLGADSLHHAHLLEQVDTAVAQSLERYQAVTRQMTHNYVGFVIPTGTDERDARVNTTILHEDRLRGQYSDSAIGPRIARWKPSRLDRIPTKEEFERYRAAREPFIISVGFQQEPISDDPHNCSQTLHALGWSQVCKWNAEYLCNRLPEEHVWLHSPVKRTARGAPQFGVTWKPVARQYASFCSFAQECFAKRPRADECSESPVSERYFDLGSTVSSDLYRFPLNVLRSDIPTPKFLDPTGLLFVALWMGASEPSNPSNSGLHFDNLDNWHIVTHGSKKWKIFGPNDAPRMGYILPPSEVTSQGHILNQEEQRLKEGDESGTVRPTYVSTWDRRGFIGRFSRRGRVFPDVDCSNASAPSQDCSISGRKNGNATSATDGTSFASTTMSTFTLRAGEAIYLPAGWAHEVESFGSHVAITYWMRPEGDQLAASTSHGTGQSASGSTAPSKKMSRKEMIRNAKSRRRPSL